MLQIAGRYRTSHQRAGCAEGDMPHEHGVHRQGVRAAGALVGPHPRYAEGRGQNYRLSIAESTAQLVIAQRDRVQARYPATPLTRLSLFPRTHRNPHGVIPAGEGRLHAAVRSWVDSLPRLVGASGEDFPGGRYSPTPSATASRSATPTTDAAGRSLLNDGPRQHGHDPWLLQGQQVTDAEGRRGDVRDAAHPPRHARASRLGALVDAAVDRYQVGQVAVP